MADNGENAALRCIPCLLNSLRKVATPAFRKRPGVLFSTDRLPIRAIVYFHPNSSAPDSGDATGVAAPAKNNQLRHAPS